jgi:UDP-3-O-[3-hydroxymyristoyl] glucosamine N-acyltransferase
METQLADLAQLVDGEIIGDGAVILHGAATLATARAGEISLADSADRLKEIGESQAAAVVVPRDVSLTGRAGIAVDDVHAAFAKIVCHFRPRRKARRIGVSPQAIVSSTAQLGEDVDVHPHAVIEDDVVIGARSTIHAGVKIMAGCRFGDDVTIFPNAVVYEDTIVGPRCTIHANAVIGAYGFGYNTKDGRHELSAQLGYVEIGADVEIGAGTTIDRGTYGPTTIGEGTKIDNLVQIAHNCRIGRHNLLCAQVGIAGSSSTGDYVVMGGQAAVRDHVHVGRGAMLGAMSGVMNDVPGGEYWLGIPATPGREQMYKQGALAKLPEMRKELKRLQKKVEGLAEGRSRLEPPAAA